MGKIKELREKVKDGTATAEEAEELNDLETEAAEPKEGEEAPAGEPAKEDDSAGEPNEDELKSLGAKLAEYAIDEVARATAKKDIRKGAIIDGEPEKKANPYAKMGKDDKVKEFFAALLENDHTKLDHLSEGTNADGGFLVPAEYANDFVRDRRDAVVMRAAGATQIKTTAATFNVPSLSTRPRMYWAAELASKSSTSASFANITLTPYTLAAIMTASNQVLADAKIGGSLVSVITDLMTQAIAEFEDRAFFVGSGSGQPTGLNSYTFTEISLGLTTTATELISGMFRLGQGYRSRAVWFMNGRVLGAIRSLADSQNRPIFIDVMSDEAPNMVGKLLGRPVYEQNDLESSSIFFGDPSYYWIADNGTVSVKISEEASVGGVSAFERNFTAIRVEERVDGELTLANAFIEFTNTGIA